MSHPCLTWSKIWPHQAKIDVLEDWNLLRERCARFKLGLPILLKLTAVESGGICKQWPDRQRENVPRLFDGLFQKKAPPAWLSALFQKGDAWGRCFPRHFLVERGWFSGTRFEDKKLRSTPLRRGRKPVASAQKRSPLRKEIYEISMIVVFPNGCFKVFPLICPLFWLFQAPHPRCCGLAASEHPHRRVRPMPARMVYTGVRTLKGLNLESKPMAALRFWASGNGYSKKGIKVNEPDVRAYSNWTRAVFVKRTGLFFVVYFITNLPVVIHYIRFIIISIVFCEAALMLYHF